MSGTDHLAKAKDYIAKGDDYYAKAADEIIAAREQDPSLTFAAIGRRLDKSESWAHSLVQSRLQRAGDAFEPNWRSGSNKRDEVTRTTLSNADEQTVEEIVASLPEKAIEKLVTKGTDRLVQNARAQRAEHRTEPTVRELSGGDRFDPSEHWADTLVIRVNRNARELADKIKRAGGLLYGSMTPAEAFEYLHEAEGMIAEARAAAQEQVHDEVQV